MRTHLYNNVWLCNKLVPNGCQAFFVRTLYKKGYLNKYTKTALQCIRHMEYDEAPSQEMCVDMPLWNAVKASGTGFYLANQLGKELSK